MRQEEIYREYADRVYKYLMSISCGNHTLSEELTQETFFRAITHADSFDGSVKIYTWLCTIAKNLYFSHLRQEKRRADSDPDEITVTPDLLSDIAEAEIYKAVHKLPEPYKEIVLLRIHTDLSFKKIGEIFGFSESRARVTFYRGKELLKDILGKA